MHRKRQIKLNVLQHFFVVCQKFFIIELLKYKEKLVKIEIVKSVSISERYMGKACSNDIIDDNLKELLPSKSDFIDDKKSPLMESING